MKYSCVIQNNIVFKKSQCIQLFLLLRRQLKLNCDGRMINQYKQHQENYEKKAYFCWNNSYLSRFIEYRVYLSSNNDHHSTFSIFIWIQAELLLRWLLFLSQGSYVSLDFLKVSHLDAIAFFWHHFPIDFTSMSTQYSSSGI